SPRPNSGKSRVSDELFNDNIFGPKTSIPDCLICLPGSTLFLMRNDPFDLLGRVHGRRAVIGAEIREEVSVYAGAMTLDAVAQRCDTGNRPTIFSQHQFFSIGVVLAIDGEQSARFK